MGFLDNLKEDVTKDAAAAKVKIDETTKTAEQKLETPEGRKWAKYAVYGALVIVILAFGSCMLRGCGSKQNKNMALGGAYTGDGVTAPVQPVQQAPVQYAQPQQGMSTGEALALGALAGYVVGQTRLPDGRIYDGSPQQQVIVKKYYVSHPAEAKSYAAAHPAPVAAAPVAPAPKVLTPAEQKSLDQKAIKASADKAAEAEKAKMQAEQAEKSRQAQLKADLQAKQAARASAPAPKPSGFAAFSQKASAPAKSSYSAPARSSSSGSSRRR